MNNDNNWNEFTKTVKKLPAKKKHVDTKVVKNIEVKSNSEKRSVNTAVSFSSSKIKSGKVRPEAKIDLHGITLENAYKDLINFIKFSHANGFKFLLVVTGKAKTSPQSTIRRELPFWLETNKQISNLVKSCSSASKNHGGEGAFYVVLNDN